MTGKVLQWLMFQMSGIGSMLGQAHHFRICALEKVGYAIATYTNEATCLYGVLEQRQANKKFIACNQYTLADVAIFPWLRSWENQGIDWADYPLLKDWLDLISQRPAVQVLAEQSRPLTENKARNAMLGSAQYAKR